MHIVDSVSNDISADLLQELQHELSGLEDKMLQAVKERESLLNDLHPRQRLAAQNLLHYLELRKNDIHGLQEKLHAHGLSSLTHAESYIHSQVQTILHRLDSGQAIEHPDECTYEYSQKEMQQKTEALFGTNNDPSIPYLMVTFDTSFADNYGLIKNLLLNGMNVVRINCAHDDEATWARMIHHVKKASEHTGLSCKIYMDLAGPKIRVKLLKKGRKKGKAKIKEGQLIWLSDKAKDFDKDDLVMSFTEKGIISNLQKGETVLIDDGIIEGVVEKTKKDRTGLRIVRISSRKSLLKTGKGINLPDADLDVPPLTKFDRACLPFICAHADLVGYSFVRSPSDINVLQDELKAIASPAPHVILKIETPDAVTNFPALLLQGMRQKIFGAMIARGDLAVEVGFERLGEIQDEILAICEAAHVPVIWATQVLETLNKSGVATRSEITDATHAAIAECVMINKGDHTIEVIETLRDVLRRSGGRASKKRFTFRPLLEALSFEDQALASKSIESQNQFKVSKNEYSGAPNSEE